MSMDESLRRMEFHVYEEIRDFETAHYRERDFPMEPERVFGMGTTLNVRWREPP